MGLLFEWDPRKAAANLRKHRVGFTEASSAFGDPLSIAVPDPGYSGGEERLLLLGMSLRRRLLVVSHTIRGARIRIISAREATNQERRDYEEEG